jgi:hypothetical protein
MITSRSPARSLSTRFVVMSSVRTTSTSGYRSENSGRRGASRYGRTVGIAPIRRGPPDLRLSKLRSAEYFLRVGVEDLTSVRQANRPGKPHKEGRPNGVFQSANLQRERRLSYPFLLSSLCEAAISNDGTKIPELLKFHAFFMIAGPANSQESLDRSGAKRS